jgi:eukaryotic-like serine/threonine-protein kinase
MIGRRLGHYRIVALLGEGGMGVVYRALDENLEREVALKVLPAGSLADHDSRRRFRREALALSRLQHSNVGVIHDFDSQDGVDYLVMELVPGEGLDERIRRGRLSQADVLRVGEQIAEGLSAAHASGVLHRDIKPQNLRITPSGQIKLLDFGLARALPSKGTWADTVTAPEFQGIGGTLPYMSPEQMRGETLDERSDLHAVGAVLYELVSGRRAFERPTTEATMLAVLHEAPASLASLGIDVGPELERIISKCLEKSVSDRYQSARELAVDLRRLAQRPTNETGGDTRPARTARWWPRIAVAGAIAAVALLMTTALLHFDAGGVRTRLFGGAKDQDTSLAVLPLANLSGGVNDESFADGMTDELITRLAQVSALRVISRTSVMRYKGTHRSLRDIARELGVGMIVEGSVLRAGNMVRISAQLIEARSDRNVWADSYEKDLRDVLRLQSEVAGAVVANVRVRLTAAERTRIDTAPRVNPQAFESYLHGVAEFNRQSTEGYRAALEDYQRAIALDSTYAPAYVGLALAYEYMSGIYMNTTEALPKARAALARAMQLEPGNAAAYAALGYSKMSHDWDWSGAEESFRHALKINPNEATVHENYGVLLVVLGRFDEASRELEHAREIDPLAPLTATQSLWPLFEGRRWDEAVAHSRRIAQENPTGYMPRMVLGQSLLFRGDHKQGIKILEAATRLDPGNPFPLGWLGYAYAVSGQRTRALAILDTLERMPPARYVQPYTLALVHVGLGDREKALTLLEQGVRDHTDEVVLLGVDPAMDPLRDEPRFQALLRTLGLRAKA